jgi:hypothetical protein
LLQPTSLIDANDLLDGFQGNFQDLLDTNDDVFKCSGSSQPPIPSQTATQNLFFHDESSTDLFPELDHLGDSSIEPLIATY